MNVKGLTEAEQLAARVGHVYVATADLKGWPHVAAARSLVHAPEERVTVTEWFCPVTMANLQANPHLSLVVWDSTKDVGYQLIGDLEEIRSLGMLDGYVPEIEAKSPIPQEERQLLVHITRIVEFKRAPHSDIEE
jgi:hypothetical protein